MLMIGSLKLYIYMTSSHGIYYSSISDYIEENGKEYFIDMYDPKSYFDQNIKKEKLTEINNIEVSHFKDPRNTYCLYFENIITGTSLGMMFDRTKDIGESMEDYTIQKYDNYQIYVHKDDTPTIIGENKEYIIYLNFEDALTTKEFSDRLKNIGIEMIKDIFELNSK